MVKKSKTGLYGKSQKRLAKLVLAALLCTGGAHYVMSPSVAHAEGASGNTLTISADCGVVYGGLAQSGDQPGTAQIGGYSSNASDSANNNTVTVTGGTLSEGVYGGYSYSGKASNNTVTVTGGTITGNTGIYGGSTNDNAEANEASNNTIEISGGEIRYVYGGISGTANGNTVTIKESSTGSPTVLADGWIHGAIAMSGDATNNTVNILVNNLTFGGLVGGAVEGGSGTSSGNTLNIRAKNVTVGYVDNFQNMNFYLPSDIAKNNTMLTVNGGTATNIQDVKFGVKALNGVTLQKGDTVNLLKNESGLTGTMSTTASTNFWTAEFLTPHNLAYDDKIELSISQGTNAIIATVNNITADSGSGDSNNTNTNSGGGDSNNTNTNSGGGDSNNTNTNSGGGDSNNTNTNSGGGDSNNTNTNTGGGDSNNTNTNSGGGGSNNNNNNNTNAGNPDRLKSPVETRAGVVTMLNAAADLMAGQGMQNAADAVAQEKASGNGGGAPGAGSFAPFGAIGGSSIRAQSGSHVDTKGISLGLGFAKEIENKQGKLLFGPVVEYGHGKYDSYQDSGIKADGHSNYWGLGIIARQTNHDGFYYEGSLRGGKTKSDYSSQLSPVTHASYDSKATYFAAHIGIGKLVDIGHDNTLDYYGKYFYSHTGGDDPVIYINGVNAGNMRFDGVDSNRIRLGARITHALNEKNKIYGGLAYQYEFSGDARATYLGNTTPSPSVKGSSGMMELGWQVKPGKSPLVVDLGVTGWVGKQRGVTANLQFNWTF